MNSKIFTAFKRIAFAALAAVIIYCFVAFVHLVYICFGMPGIYLHSLLRDSSFARSRAHMPAMFGALMLSISLLVFCISSGNILLSFVAFCLTFDVVAYILCATKP